jgi:hypothetical protein
MVEDTRYHSLYLDPAAVAAHGYPQTLLDKGGDQPTVKAQSATAAKPVTPEELSAYTGAPAQGNAVARSATAGKIPPCGCAGQGDREITGASDLPASARSLAADIMFAARDDSRVQKVFAQWSLCMSGKGFRYHSPLDAQIDPRWGRRTASTPATGAEKQTATADAQCQQQANVVGVYKAAEAALGRAPGGGRLWPVRVCCPAGPWRLEGQGRPEAVAQRCAAPWLERTAPYPARPLKVGGGGVDPRWDVDAVVVVRLRDVQHGRSE